jgi:hypothetical protein
LAALAVLMKPKPYRRDALRHRTGEQPWPTSADAALAEALATARERLGLALDVHRPVAGEYHFLIEFDRAQTPAMLGVAALVSAALPKHWFALDRLFVHGGAFHRRRFGHQLQLVRAANVHVPREVRAMLPVHGRR